VKLFLRTFTNCENQETAQTIEARLILALTAFSPEAAARPKPYWKIADQFEFTFVLSPATEVSFQAIISASSGGWQHLEVGAELSSVWNRKNDHVFLVPEVSWAGIDLHETAA
jgi:hypothetical protein